MSLKLYLLRHGETTASLTGSYCGRLDLELTPSGAEMAKDFAKFYQDLPWTAVYCSPLKRTLATAKPICELLGLDINLRDGLKEIYYGQWEGKSPEEVNQEYHDDYVRWLADPGWNAPTDGEKGIDISRRSSEVLEEIEHTHSSGNILIVSHKATIRIILCYLLGIDVGRFRDRIGMPVASVSVVELARHGPLIHVMGDRSHLRQDLRKRLGT
ncbi:histidine phosphatase family protein [Aphanothece hegewaldii CCALA 016]|uniref:Histidine phosphatase family protein n=1 Tax=Aphanothece hegewaldii CCALA 016 TaxID=2107694 RepID=A0A2T1M2I4_9CHRO|nr:histidine phosphatase family protein [Aphanothece hegewaldii]PSF38966.1 histidine phosphatase family protein [Aphanothece hegewaldii CCALA 016]